MIAPLLEARDIAVSYPGRGGSLFRPPRRDVLRGVSLSLEAGGAVGLVGESGSGKTTLLLTLLGFLEPDAGEVLLNGTALKGPGRARRRMVSPHVQPVFQESLQALNPRMEVRRTLLEGPVARSIPPEAFGAGHRREIPGALLERVGLDPSLAGRRPDELSGGERQRVCIARALSVRPAALLLDEPVSALDVSAQAGILDLLEVLRNETGVGVLLVSHDLGVVAQSCERIHVLSRGRIVETGPAREILRDPGDPATVRLVGAIPGLPGGSREPPPTSGSS